MPNAYNAKWKMTHISKIDQNNRNDKYYCMLCRSEVRPRSISEENKMLPHFYHLDRGKCTGESLIHKINKDILFTETNNFEVSINGIKKRYPVW